MARRLPDSLEDAHAEILRLRERVRCCRREIADLNLELERSGDFAYRLLDDREFLAEQLDVSRSVGTTRLGFYGRIADPYTNCPEDVP